MALVVFLYIQGSRTLIHYLAWKYLPFTSSFRGPGRISLIMPVLIMPVLMWVVQAESSRIKLAGKDFHILPQTILALAGLLLTVVFACTSGQTQPSHNPYIYNAIHIRKIPVQIEHIITVVGIISLAALTAQGFLSRKESPLRRGGWTSALSHSLRSDYGPAILRYLDGSQKREAEFRANDR